MQQDGANGNCPGHGKEPSAEKGCRMSEPLDHLTLQQKLSEAEKLVRDLIDHLEHGAIPKMHILRRTANPGGEPDEPSDVTDMTVRSTVESVLNSGRFTDQVSKQLSSYLAAISDEVEQFLEKQ
jgi:hypothetical protein